MGSEVEVIFELGQDIMTEGAYSSSYLSPCHYFLQDEL